MEEKKKPNIFLKILLTLGLAILSGIVSGVIFLGISIGGTAIYRAIVGDNTVVDGGNGIGTDPEAVDPEDPLAGLEILGNPEPDAPDGPTDEEDVIAISDTDMTVIDVVKHAMPSVVSIKVTADLVYYGEHYEADGAGSGIIVGETEDKLLIATNYHVVADEIDTNVVFCDDSEVPAEVKGKKVSMDLAVLSVNKSDMSEETLKAIKVVTIGDSDSLIVGQSCIAIGNALGYGQAVTTGVVSALNREVTTENGEKGHFIQTDAAINPGNSGGALLNLKGELIGINSAKIGGSSVEGMGYAIPISEAMPIISQLMDKKDLVELPSDQQSYFGISGTQVQSGLTTSDGSPIPKGIYVAGVVDGSAAGNAGIKKGDIITEFEGDSIVNMDELKRYLASYSSGSKVTITYKRYENGKYVEYTTEVELGKKE